MRVRGHVVVNAAGPWVEAVSRLEDPAAPPRLHLSKGVHVAVRDSGPGIDGKHLPYLFEPFYRVDGARHSDGHLGLGLFLVKTHVQAIGGEVSVASTVGAGTTFSIRLTGRLRQPDHGNGQEMLADHPAGPGRMHEAEIPRAAAHLS